MKTRAEALEYVRKETDSRGKVSQRGRVLHLLLSAPEIELPKILDLRISQYNARINELRGLGFDVRNRTAHISGVVHSWYSLRFDPPGAPCSGDWFERQTGHPREPAAPDLGPLFRDGNV
jgi:hypothetical protein